MKVNKKFKHILIIDNFDSFTYNLVDYFRRLGCKVDIYRNDIEVGKIADINPELIVFSPGPSIPEKAGNMMAIIDKYHQNYPMFGVCLGHEAFIEYFGGSLKLVPPVHGKSTDVEHDGKTIFTGLDQPLLGGRYHSLAADKVPECFDISAVSKVDPEGNPAEEVVMAIRHKTLPIEGVQFHPESILTMQGENGFRMIENVVNKRFCNLQK